MARGHAYYVGVFFGCRCGLSDEGSCRVGGGRGVVAGVRLGKSGVGAWMEE
jgi:hypothetical protein